ncbi:MAG: hypothetical protein IID33_01980, partial [Planctomycetes bacterium]|nr:hypothetical protein [Planctomycetota bacterium]
EGAARAECDARRFIASGGRPEIGHELIPLERGRTRSGFVQPAVTSDFRYRVEIGGTQSPIYSVSVREPLSIARIGTVFHHPAYTRLARREDVPAAGPIEAPLGTRVDLFVDIDTPVAAARLLRPDKTPVVLRDRGDGQYFSTQFVLSETGAYAVAILDANGRVIDRRPQLELDSVSDGGAPPGYYPIRVKDDRRPTVECLAPARDVNAAPGETITLRFRGSDDWGLSEFTIRSAHAENDPSRVLARAQWRDHRKSAVIEHELLIDPQVFAEGDVITVWAVALDNRDLPDIGGPQPSSDAEHPPRVYRITVVDKERLARERATRIEELRRRLLAILEIQISTRAATVELRAFAANNQLFAVEPQTKEVADGQRRVAKDLYNLGVDFEFEADLLELKQAILLLAANDATAAKTEADGLNQITEAAPLAEAAGRLTNIQARIIDAVRTMLALALQGNAEDADGKISRPGGDLPPMPEADLQALLEKLREFIDQQRKVIIASQHLAKRPVDDFSDDEQARLEELIAAEEDWIKFLEETIADLSKLPEQDFSNASLLKELIEIRDDVVMAKGALEKKAVEIAVPLEEAGLELAETLETHLEKWLPDEPDRIKWSMEEPLDQTDVPMAELPNELEDLIGELLEEEEDLYDEMDDVTSKWTDSLDKGAGWDALDGPISNMSAQGVTGNQLPNTSEIAGRSGEGRTGKASGEMVEESATGKGGRRTPTRLSPDAFQEGQINDSSNEPPGGATGGGKLAGLSGEGLEGPVPAQVREEMARLARRQATLRNKGEKIDARFKVSNFKSFKLQEAIRMMRRNEDDLANFRYRNVLRRRNEVLGALNTQRMLLGGEIMVKTDSTPAAAKRLRDDIADVMQGELPPGFKDLLRKYYERLSEGGGP